MKASTTQQHSGRLASGTGVALIKHALEKLEAVVIKSPVLPSLRPRVDRLL